MPFHLICVQMRTHRRRWTHRNGPGLYIFCFFFHFFIPFVVWVWFVVILGVCMCNNGIFFSSIMYRMSIVMHRWRAAGRYIDARQNDGGDNYLCIARRVHRTPWAISARATVGRRTPNAPMHSQYIYTNTREARRNKKRFMGWCTHIQCALIIIWKSLTWRNDEINGRQRQWSARGSRHSKRETNEEWEE